VALFIKGFLWFKSYDGRVVMEDGNSAAKVLSTGLGRNRRLIPIQTRQKKIVVESQTKRIEGGKKEKKRKIRP
jgi:hypothetical protein